MTADSVRSITTPASVVGVPTQGQQPPQQKDHKKWMYMGVGAFVLIAVAVYGVQLVRGNSDWVCYVTVSDQGMCTNGAWSNWATISQTTNADGATNITEQRTYTGTRQIQNGSLTFTGIDQATLSASRNFNSISCSLGGRGLQQGSTGTITTAYSACQIQETRVRSIASTGGAGGTGAGGNGSAGAGSGDSGTIVSVSSSESTGGFVGTSTTVTGGYDAYSRGLDSGLATSSITAVPLLVRPNDSSVISWKSALMKSCVVTSDNGDSWMGLSGNQISKPITRPTVFTLTCTRSGTLSVAADGMVSVLGGTTSSKSVTVSIIPTWRER